MRDNPPGWGGIDGLVFGGLGAAQAGHFRFPCTNGFLEGFGEGGFVGVDRAVWPGSFVRSKSWPVPLRRWVWLRTLDLPFHVVKRRRQGRPVGSFVRVSKQQGGEIAAIMGQGCLRHSP